MTDAPIRFDRIDPDDADRVVQALSAYVSEPRQRRIERALASRTRDVAVVLEDIFNEHNASAVLRSAEAFGLFEVHAVPREHRFRLSRKVSIGSHKWLDIHQHTDPGAAYADLRLRGYRIFAADVHGEPVDLGDIPVDRPLALLFGNEHAGLSEEALAAADGVFQVPMTGFVESLNISVAAAVALYDVVARRRRAGLLRPLEPDELRRVRAAWYAQSVRASPQLLEREGLPRPSMHVKPLTFFERVPGGGTETLDPVDPEDAAR